MKDSISKSLDVYWNERLVGRYDKFASGSEQFVYASNYLTSDAALPISQSLPLREMPFSGPELRPSFSGLLPEECAPVLDLVQTRARKILKEASLKV